MATTDSSRIGGGRQVLMASRARPLTVGVVSCGVAVAWLGGGCQSDWARSDLEGRPCPCLPQWVCDTTLGQAGQCVPASAVLGGDGGVAPADRGAGGARASDDGGASGSSAGGAVGMGDSGGASAGGDSSGASGSGGSGGAAGDSGGVGGFSGASGSGTDAGASGGSSADACPAAAEPTGTTCPEVCDECSAGTCYIRCDDVRSCSGTADSPLTIECPTGFHCDVACSGVNNCNSLEISCPENYACSPRCSGRRSCRELIVSCGTGSCTLGCGNEVQVCRGAELRCGTGACRATCESREFLLVSGCENSCAADCGC